MFLLLPLYADNSCLSCFLQHLVPFLFISSDQVLLQVHLLDLLHVLFVFLLELFGCLILGRKKQIFNLCCIHILTAPLHIMVYLSFRCHAIHKTEESSVLDHH